MLFRSIPLARRVSAVLLTGLLAGGLAACSSSGGNDSAGASSGASSAAAGGHTVNVTITGAKGCVPDTHAPAAGGITFKITNQDATGVTEIELLDGKRILGEKENLPPGLSGEFAVTVPAGSYTLYCPGAATENTTITATGDAPTTANEDVAQLLSGGTAAYGTYVETQVQALVATSQKLAAAIKGGDLKAAQAAYVAARPFYEKIEPVAESFTVGDENLDADIDARENDVPAADWKGFHKIEKGLWVAKSTDGLSPLADELVTNTTKLLTLVTGLKYQPTELANGAQGLLDEAASGKLTGEEERYSHIDMLDINFNVEGSEQAFLQLQPGLAKIDSVLTEEITTQFDALHAEVEKFADKRDPSGYVRYTALTDGDLKELAAALKAVQEPLSKVASKVANV